MTVAAAIPVNAFTRVITLAGNPSTGDSVLKEPHAVAAAPDGTIYVASTSHNEIRAIAPDGTVTVLARGFKEPRGVAFDAQRNCIYVADTGNHAVRAVTREGVVTTLAGGPSLQLFKDPSGVAVDAAGNVYVADTGRHVIKRITPSGVVTLFAGNGIQRLGNGAALLASFNEPKGLAVHGNVLYVADANNHAIRKIAGGMVSTVAAAGLAEPSGVAVDESGAVFVADLENSRIRRIDPVTGTMTVVAGSGEDDYRDGAPAAARFKEPHGIAVSGSALYVADTKNNAVRAILATLQLTGVEPSRGPVAGGNSLAVRGSGFVPGRTTAAIGGVAATVTTVQQATVTLKAPAGQPGPAAVAVTAFGVTATVPSSYTYVVAPAITAIEPSTGTTAGGGPLTVRGSDFVDGATSVVFGTTPAASVVVERSTAATVYAPPNAPGAADVTLTTPGGTATLANGFLYLAPPLISGFVPAAGLAGTPVAVSGSGFDPVPSRNTVFFGSIPAAVLNATPLLLTVAVPANAVTAPISVTTAGGTATTLLPFTVPLPVALVVDPQTAELEVGETRQFRAFVSYSDGVRLDVTGTSTWSSANGSVATVSPTGLATAISSGTATITATLAALRGEANVTVASTEPLPPDPATVAPAFEPGTAPSFEEATAFLYTGASPIQQGVAPGTIEPLRASVIRGRVLTGAGQPLGGVTVTIAEHPEFGETRSRADGAFDLAVNGGGDLTVRLVRAGFLPADRTVRVPWLDYVATPDVVLVPLDSAVTTILSGAATSQVARGSSATDDDGTRRATLIFAPGTSATLRLADGTAQPLPEMSVRATEYTVGPRGPSAMPAALPPTSGYTYAVELSVDQAMNANATAVELSQPASFYVENFLGFATGTRVPLAWYDRMSHAWIPSPDGRVVSIVSVDGGVASVDTDGDGTADDTGIDATERQQLASLYAAGTSLWRAAIPHFTPWDLNFSVGIGLPPSAITPNRQPTYFAPHDNPGCTTGSIIECENQTLGEDVAVTGAGIALHYRSDRTPGRTASRTLDIPVIGETVPPGLLRAEIEVSVAGTFHRATFPAQPDQRFRYTWSGRDVYGRALSSARVLVRTIYVYEAMYLDPVAVERSFALPSGVATGVPARIEASTFQLWEGVLGTWDAGSLRIGGWTLSPHHFYDVHSRTLYRGDGSRRSDVPQIFGVPDGVLATIAGRADEFDYNWNDAGGPASTARVGEINGIGVAPDGTVYLAAWTYVMKITPDGQLVRVAGLPGFDRPTDADQIQPASSARVYGVRDVAVGPDGTVYVAEANEGRVRIITPDGMIRPFAGNSDGSPIPGGEGIDPLSARLQQPVDVAFGPEGSVYIAEADAGRVRRVSPDGLIYTVAGNGTVNNYSGDGGPATNAALSRAASIAVAQDGTLYIADASARIRRVGTDGIITTIAGNGVAASTGDGGPAVNASVNIGLSVNAYLAVGADGSVYFSEWSGRIRRIDPAGIINSIVGTGARHSMSPDGTRASAAEVEWADALTTGPDGTLYFSDWHADLLRKIGPTQPAFRGPGEIAIADGELIHIFTHAGRHLRTLHTDTGAALYTFHYSNGLLASIEDVDGNTIEIERSGGAATAIVAPGGQRTALSGTPYLTAITTAPGETVSFEYTAGGLMTEMTDARSNSTTFDWDELGLLIRDAGPEGSAKGLERTQNDDGHAVEVTTAGGRTTSHVLSHNSKADEARRTVSPSNLTSRVDEQRNGLTTVSAPDGTQLSTRETPDPVWSSQAPFVSSATMTWPSGRTLTMTTEREATFADPHDVLSLTARTDRVTVNGKTTTRVFDRDALTETITMPSGFEISRELDSAGRTRRSIRPGVLPVALSYDSQGRLETVVQGLRTQTFGYNARNELTSVEDPTGRIVRFEYDGAGRVTKQILPDLREIAFTYDPNGNLLSVTPPGRSAHSFVYSGVNLPTRYTPPAVAGTGVTEYIYDVDKQLEQIVRPDATIALGYDDGGRLESVSSRGLLLEYAYDEGGNVETIDGLDASLTYSYDGSSPLSMTWSGAVSGAVTWTYDDDGRLFSESVGGELVEFYYDADGRLEVAGDAGMSYTDGLLDEVNDLLTLERFTHDSFGDLETMTHIWWVDGGSPQGVFTERTYTRDDAGRIIGITESRGATSTPLGYHYDDAGRLDEVTYPEGLVRYTYDDNGNRTSRQIITAAGTEAETASYDDQDRLLNYEGTQYTYTAGGDLLTKVDGTGTTEYDYDPLGNLRKVTLGDGTVIEYLIDAQSRRVGRKVNGTVTHTWLYADQLRIISETDHTRGGLVKRFVYAARSNAPSYMSANGTYYRIFTDQLGSVREVFNTSTQTVAQSLRYDEFGYVLTDTNPGLVPFAFAGGLYDLATRLTRFGARDYDARAGRWTAKDPIGFGGGDSNVYGYSANDPVNQLDPNGLEHVQEPGFTKPMTPENVGPMIPTLWKLLPRRFRDGVSSYGQGIASAARYGSRISGLQGQCEQREALFESMTGLGAALFLPAAAVEYGPAFARENKGYIAGRAVATYGATAALGGLLGPAGAKTGLALGQISILGTVTENLEQWNHNLSGGQCSCQK